ncbi:phage terminase small subunit P27 family [Ruegeria marina]|uniref:Phage terminase, small subunit, putative, P27 family n=1 Tax=Ruegeria marina TaxID=639004 RepID=A0A1G6YEF5_9RHOB|nr:phage terminase small subunit P27 family [Ruegeria marina]SDD88712.1 phage terminase, small subunit, putative, P27 family [Ruegeria marina]
MRGRKPYPGKRDAPRPPDALPRCPAHLTPVAAKEWRRLAKPLYDMGVLSITDRAALAAYCQAWARWVEAEEKLRETPMLIRTPSGYAQQSPWLSIANKQMELMGRYMAELGLTPAARARLPANAVPDAGPVTVFRVLFQGDDNKFRDQDGNIVEDDGDTEQVRQKLM